MFQSVLTSRNITVEKLEKDYINALNNISDDIINKLKFGVDINIDYIKSIKIKNLLPLVQNINNIPYLKHYFNTTDTKEVINKLNSILKS